MEPTWRFNNHRHFSRNSFTKIEWSSVALRIGSFVVVVGKLFGVKGLLQQDPILTKIYSAVVSRTDGYSIIFSSQTNYIWTLTSYWSKNPSISEKQEATRALEWNCQHENQESFCHVLGRFVTIWTYTERAPKWWLIWRNLLFWWKNLFSPLVTTNFADKEVE